MLEDELTYSNKEAVGLFFFFLVLIQQDQFSEVI